MAGDDAAGLSVFIVGFSGLAPGADALDNVEALSAVALAGVEVVDLVGSALDSADHLVDVVELAFRAFGAEVVDQVESGLADTSVQDPVLVLGADRSANTVAALPAHFLEAGNAVTALSPLVVDLRSPVALAADSVDQVESREASARTDSGVPDFISLALSAADSVDTVVGLSGRADTAGVADQVVSFFADTGSVLVNLIGVAGRSAETKVLDEASVARAGLGDFIVVGVGGADVAGAIIHLKVLRKAHTLAFTDIIDPLRIARNSANAQSLVINFIPVALSTDSVDGVEASLAAAFSVQENLVDSAANHTESAS